MGESGQQGGGHRSRHPLRNVLQRTCRTRLLRKWTVLERRAESQQENPSRGARRCWRRACAGARGGAGGADLGGSSDDSGGSPEGRGGDGFPRAGALRGVSRGLSVRWSAREREAGGDSGATWVRGDAVRAARGGAAGGGCLSPGCARACGLLGGEAGGRTLRFAAAGPGRGEERRAGTRARTETATGLRGA